MLSQTKPAAKRVLPPWLWFWLIVYLITLPTQVTQVWLPMLQDVFARQPQPGEALIPFSFFFRFANFAELAPMVLVALGVLTVLVPRRRIRKIQQEYGLGDAPCIPAINEITEFLSQYAPGIVIKANVLRTDQLAFVYPLGYRTTAIALFGGIVKLWRQDRPAAEAVLLHEIAHYRQGDALVVRAGNFFTTLLDLWLPLLAGFVVVPISLVWGIDAIRFIFSDTGLMPLGAGIGYKINQLLTLFLPNLLLISLGLLLRTAATLSLPLIAIWCAELNADRFAANVQGSPDALVRGMATLARPTSWGRWLVSQMSHPPSELRRALVLQAAQPMGLLLPLLLYPAAYLVRLILLLARVVTVYATYMPAAEIIRALIKNTGIYLQSNTPTWFAMAALLLVWPWLAGYWERFFCRSKMEDGYARSHKGYVIGAVSLLCVWLISSLLI